MAGILVRERPTLPQSGLPQGARRENVRGVFAAPRPELIQGRPVLLIDDVMTTGATVSACAAVLKKAGAKEVAVLTLARATPLFPDTPLPVSVDDRPEGRT
jgi:predicted amidophosphoribosyltransferase